MEGARQTLTAKEESEGGSAGKRSAIEVTKLNSKVGGGTVKDVSGMSKATQPEPKVKGRTQPDITNFLAVGGQESGNSNPILPIKGKPMCLREDPEVIVHREELPQANSETPKSNQDPDMPYVCEGSKPEETGCSRGQIEQPEVVTRMPIKVSMQMQMECNKKDSQDIHADSIVMPRVHHIRKRKELNLAGRKAAISVEEGTKKAERGQKKKSNHLKMVKKHFTH
ncbi:hypothetical protein NDU88_003042 [Pleurodeles waltl]|uniref:Uncharacterized protein n=1 Tax=Pleurodeles waltl TaxID=8319 RepID=A0AAV7SFH6_PLEWA|nr:hypothetical protein NDU88_003042 [Pleurodeles waltl]